MDPFFSDYLFWNSDREGVYPPDPTYLLLQGLRRPLPDLDGGGGNPGDAAAVTAAASDNVTDSVLPDEGPSAAEPATGETQTTTTPNEPPAAPPDVKVEPPAPPPSTRGTAGPEKDIDADEMDEAKRKERVAKVEEARKYPLGTTMPSSTMGGQGKKRSTNKPASQHKSKKPQFFYE